MKCNKNFNFTTKNLKIFAKYLVDACTFDLTVFVLSQLTQYLTLLSCVFFVIDLSIDRQI